MASQALQDVKQADQLFQAGISWEADKEMQRERSERRAWIVAGAAMLIALTAVVGMATLAPLRRTVPYLFVADKVTGNVEYVGAVDDRTLTGYQELLDKYWAQRYVIARESYLYELLQFDYDSVIAMSDATTAAEFARLYDGPSARDKKNGSRIKWTISVASIHLNSNRFGNVATIRYSKVATNRDTGRADPIQYLIATFSYKYKPRMFGKEGDLLLNPLGYQVSAYRVDPELTPATPAAATTAVGG